MFEQSDVLAFFLRIDVFLLVFSAFPILFHFFRAGILKMIFAKGLKAKVTKKSKELDDKQDEVDEQSSPVSSSAQQREANDDGGETSGGFMVSARAFNITTALCLLIPFGITVFYPKIASILGYVGAVAGLFIIYLLPVCTYLCKLKNDSDNPILYQAQNLQHNYQNNKLY